MNIEPTVFLVDDDAGVRRAIRLSLQERGFAVESYESAEAFLEAYQEDRPGCLVLDNCMEGMSGLELQDALLEREYKIPIIFISGRGNIPQSVRAIRAGAVDFLEKPYNKDVLIHRIEEALAEDARTRRDDAESKAVMKRFARLTPREQQVLGLVVAGAANTSNRQIAEQLNISRRTVDHYRAEIMEKMQARSLPELVIMARQCGIGQSTD